MQLCDLLPNLSVNDRQATAIISGISADSRRIEPGHLFVAIAGHEYDGHDYITQALAAGAVAVMGERPASDYPDIAYYHSSDIRRDYAEACAKFWPKRPPMQVAVTGTNGKTSTVEFLRQIWQLATWNAASIGTLGVRTPQSGLTLDVPSLTTPGAEDLFYVIDQLGRSQIRCLALEASSHGIAQDRLAPLDIHVAGFTNLSRDHLDYHNDMDEYFAAKKQLFTTLLPDGAAAAINSDDAYGRQLYQELKDRKIVLKRIGYDADADLRILSLTPAPYGFDISLSYDGHSYHYPLALMGRFQAENAVMAAMLAHLSGLPVQDSLGALPSLKPIAGRMQPVYGHPQSARIVVDYAHTPDALRSALAQLRSETDNKLLVLFGAGGDRDAGKRALMGDAAAELADITFITDDNPRSEDPALIRQQIIGSHKGFTEIGNRKAAIQAAIDSLGAGDSLLIAGKGHETTQMIGDETLPFDDAAVARLALRLLSHEEV